MDFNNQIYDNGLTWRITNLQLREAILLTQTYKSGQNIGGIEVEGI